MPRRQDRYCELKRRCILRKAKQSDKGCKESKELHNLTRKGFYHGSKKKAR